MRVYVHGNCQAPAIANLLHEANPSWNIASFEVFDDKIIKDLSYYTELVSKADIVISQPIHDGYRNQPELSLSWIRNAVKANCCLLVFPSMFFDGQLLGCRSLSLPNCGINYHDVLLVHLASQGYAASQIYSILSADDLFTEEFIRQEIRFSIEEMKKREKDEEIDIIISEYLESYAPCSQIFHVINHPCRHSLVHVANNILKNLGCAGNVSASGYECLPFPHIPVHPSVQKFLKGYQHLPEGWVPRDQTLFHLPGEKLEPREYYERLVAALSGLESDFLIEKLNHEYVRPFLARVAVAGLAIPKIEVWKGFDTAPERVGRR